MNLTTNPVENIEQNTKSGMALSQKVKNAAMFLVTAILSPALFAVFLVYWREKNFKLSWLIEAMFLYIFSEICATIWTISPMATPTNISSDLACSKSIISYFSCWIYPIIF